MFTPRPEISAEFCLPRGSVGGIGRPCFFRSTLSELGFTKTFLQPKFDVDVQQMSLPGAYEHPDHT